MISLPGPVLFEELLVGVLAALAAGLLASWLIRRAGIIDVPGSQPHKQHTLPTPLAGGTAVVIALIPVALLFRLWELKGFWALVLPALVVYAFGLWDDAERLPPRGKLVGQLIAVGLFLALGGAIRVFKPGLFGLGFPLHTWLNLAITLLWLVGITNAFNFLDSTDGLVLGLSATALAFLLIATLLAGQPLLAQFIAALFGVLFGTLFYNTYPARFFLGDSGAQLLGFLLAGIGIYYTPADRAQASSWFVPILIMGVPIFDTTLVVFSRLRRRQHVYQAGRDHTFHRLLKLGLSTNQAVLCLTLVSLALDSLAFIALSLTPLWANLVFGACLLAGLGTVLALDHPKFWPAEDERMPLPRPAKV